MTSHDSLQAYVDHLRKISKEQPLLLLAHTFTQHTAGEQC